MICPASWKRSDDEMFLSRTWLVGTGSAVSISLPSMPVHVEGGASGGFAVRVTADILGILQAATSAGVDAYTYKYVR
jgi:hypothetical protein